MAMNVGPSSGEGEVMVEMNTTPLIDVMLVLLTLLIITLPIQPTIVELGVDFDGTVTWNGQAVDRATLDSYFVNAAAADPQPEIHLNPNRLAKYDNVAKVLADAQRIGVTHIGFTGIEQYNQ